MNDPTNWNADAEVGSFAFANPEEAKKAEAIMNRALKESFENGRNVGLEEARQLCYERAKTWDGDAPEHAALAWSYRCEEADNCGDRINLLKRSDAASSRTNSQSNQGE